MRRCHRIAMGVLAAALVATEVHGQTLANLERQLLPLQEGALKEARGVDAGLWESLAFLRAEEERQRAVKADVTFGLTGDESGSRSLFKLNTGISLNRNAYPAEITVDTLLGLQMVNGKVQEDVTSLKISYDYHTTNLLETFAFAERFSDNFLSIDQRYEVGFGGRVGFGVGRVGEWKQTERQFASLRRNLPGLRAVIPGLSPASQARLLTTGVTDEERFETTLHNLEHVIRDDQTRLFVGLAVSVFAEIENASIDDIKLEATHRYRLNLRPTIHYRASRQINFRVHPYLKLPLSGPQYVVRADGERRLDYRRDLFSEMTWTIRPEDTGVEGVDFVFAFNHFFDNVPPMLPLSVLEEGAASGRAFPRVMAEESHRFVGMSLRIRW